MCFCLDFLHERLPKSVVYPVGTTHFCQTWSDCFLNKLVSIEHNLTFIVPFSFFKMSQCNVVKYDKKLSTSKHQSNQNTKIQKLKPCTVRYKEADSLQDGLKNSASPTRWRQMTTSSSGVSGICDILWDKMNTLHNGTLWLSQMSFKTAEKNLKSFL